MESVEIDVGRNVQNNPRTSVIEEITSGANDRLMRASLTMVDPRASLTMADPRETKLRNPQDSDGLSFSETVANFVVYLVGGGVLVLPTVMRDVGLVPALTLMGVAYATTYECGVMTIKCCTALESASQPMSVSLDSYEALAGEVLGLGGKIALALTKNGYLLGLLIVFTLLVTDGFKTWFPSSDTEALRWFATLPLFATLAMVRDLKQVKRFAKVGICASFSQCALLALGAALEVMGPQFVWPKYEIVRGGMFDIGAAMATCLFSCGSVVCTVPSIRGQMARSEELPAALRNSLIIVLAIYLVVMGQCYLAFGEGLKGNALKNITVDCWPSQCAVGTMTATMVVVNLMFSIPSVAYFVISVFEATGSRLICTTLSWPNIVFRACLIAVLVFVGKSVPYVDKVINIISASFGGCNCLVFPRLFYFVLRRRDVIAQPPAERRYFDVMVHLGVFLVTLVAMPFGILGAVQKLLAEIASKKT